MKHAVRYGANAMMTFNVKDSCGQPCTNVAVSVFAYAAYGKKGETTVIHTDTNGLAVIALKTTGGIKYSIVGEGYYKTTGEFTFLKSYADWVKGGKWQPWNPTIEVTLKEKRNPIPMHVKWVECEIPLWNQPIGYDLEKGDWVVPHGKGKYADMFLCYDEDIVNLKTDFAKSFRIEFPGSCNGAYVKAKTTFSDFVSDYEAATNGYVNIFEYGIQYRAGHILKATRFERDNYFVFRTRSRVDDNGNLLTANYGKIYGAFEYSVGPNRYVRFSHYFNPNSNDRNLEFDCRNNLLDPSDRITIP